MVLLNPNITLKITVFYCWKKIKKKKKKKNWEGRGIYGLYVPIGQEAATLFLDLVLQIQHSGASVAPPVSPSHQ